MAYKMCITKSACIYTFFKVVPGQENRGVVMSTNCSAVAYTGEACRDELLAQQSCLMGRDIDGGEEIHSPQTTSQVELEIQARQLLTVGLPLVQPSAECEAVLRPFLCLFMFGLCDSDSGQVYQPSFNECVTLTTETCAREWQTALTIFGQERLPDCGVLPGEIVLCEVTSGMYNIIASFTLIPNEFVCPEGMCRQTAFVVYSSWIYGACMYCIWLAVSDSGGHPHRWFRRLCLPV